MSQFAERLSFLFFISCNPHGAVGNEGAWTWTRMISLAHLNRAFPRLMACFGPNPSAVGAVLMLLIQAVITFSHGHFFCLYTVFITDFQLFIFFPFSCYPSLFFFADFFWPSCLIFHLLFGFFFASNSCVSRPSL